MTLRRKIAFAPLGFLLAAIALDAAGIGLMNLAVYVVPLIAVALIGITRLAESRSSDERTAREWGMQRTALTRFLLFMVVVVVVLVTTLALLSAGGVLRAVGTVLMPGFLLGCGAVALFAGLAPARFVRLLPGRRGYREALALVWADRPDEAIEPLSRHTTEHPSDAEALYLQSRLLLGRGRVGAAFDSIEQGVALKETSVGLTARAYGLKLIGAVSEAAAIYAKVHDSEPLMWNLCPGYAEILLELRRPHAAIQVMKEEQKALRTSFSALTFGRAYRMAGDDRTAASHFEDAARRAEKESKSIKSNAEYGATALAYLGADRECASLLYEIEMRNSTAFEARAILDLLSGNRDAVHARLFTQVPAEPTTVVNLLTDPLFTPLQSEARFRRLLAWALGLQRTWREQIRVQYPALFA
jgi:tetratricopeptide (TPR) repeat protein